MQISWQAQHFVNLDVQIAWQAQHFVKLDVQISWQAQHFVKLDVQIAWQAQHFVKLDVQISWQETAWFGARWGCTRCCAAQPSCKTGERGRLGPRWHEHPLQRSFGA